MKALYSKQPINNVILEQKILTCPSSSVYPTRETSTSALVPLPEKLRGFHLTVMVSASREYHLALTSSGIVTSFSLRWLGGTRERGRERGGMSDLRRTWVRLAQSGKDPRHFEIRIQVAPKYTEI